MTTLFNFVYSQGVGIRWGLVPCTVLMIPVVTVYTAAYLSIQSIPPFINREFSDVKCRFPPGRLGYQWLARSISTLELSPTSCPLGELVSQLRSG